jgi:mono/diheme cytochrome c family protein
MNVLPGVKAIITAGSALVWSASSGLAQDTSFGERLYHEKADCAFCHGPLGDGRGDPRSPGKAANLRTTTLKREHLIEVVTCGRPRTEMPHFDKYAYEDTACYGLTPAQVGDGKPPPPHAGSLNQREIAAVVDYILTTFVGK